MYVCKLNYICVLGMLDYIAYKGEKIDIILYCKCFHVSTLLACHKGMLLINLGTLF